MASDTPTPPALPRATYRVQLNAQFTFAQAAELADYLAALGISHLYASPILQAAPGSMHGYDVADHEHISGDLGGAEGFERLIEALRARGLGLVVDVVPNHMAIIGRCNGLWWDVLQNGQVSQYARWFDVDWEAPSLHNKVLLPVLEDHIGIVVESERLRLVRDDAQFTFDLPGGPAPAALESLADLFDSAAVFSSNDELARLVAERPEVAQAVDAAIEKINSDPAVLIELLDRQHYRLAWWRLGGSEGNYRRFFAVDSLAAICMERPEVFEHAHQVYRPYLERGLIDGIRVDHPDGLRRPEEYLRELRKLAPNAWMLVEKIIEPGEDLPASWPVEGTTGYEFINRLTGIYIDPAGQRPLTDFYARFTGESTDFPGIVRRTKLKLLGESFGGDIDRLARLWTGICVKHRRYADYAQSELAAALRELVASFPVYRTYVITPPPEGGESGVTETDEKYLHHAVEQSRRNRPDIDGRLFDFFLDLMFLHLPGRDEFDFVDRFQQLTGAAMAKGVEDTAYYIFNRLVSLNEVGGDPAEFGMTLEEFHRQCQYTQERWPLTMLTTSTHDTKRSEDVRARINLLSEIPQAWAAAVEQWNRINTKHHTGPWPDANAEYMYYQNLLGAWPIEPQRMHDYMTKACREAKQHTSHLRPDAQYEAALHRFIDGTLADAEFLASFEQFWRPLVLPGRINSLSQVLLKCTAPGVPDFYQGNEIWDNSLVDPDNRRPVDFAHRRDLLAKLPGITPEEVLAGMEAGLPKLHVIARSLRTRRQHPEAFGPEGTYQPLQAQGAKAYCVVAFQRGRSIIAIAPRLVVRLGVRIENDWRADWQDTTIELPHGRWRNAMTDEEVAGGRAVPLADLLRRFPVALLVRQEGRP